MTASRPLVSVVLPVKDAADTVLEAVESILEQTLRDLELIVVDDGSVDGTDRVLASVDDPRVIVLRHPVNLGLVPALRAGIDTARAEVIARMDADDAARPERLVRQYAILQRHASVGLVSTAFVAVDSQGRELQQHGVPPDHAAAWFRLHFANCLAHPTVMFRRVAYDAAGGYDERLVPAEDHDLWLRMAERVEIATIPEPLLRYRHRLGPNAARAVEERARTSAEVAARAIERTTGRRPAARVVEVLRADHARSDCHDARAVVAVVVPVYTAIKQACAARGIGTANLSGQLATLLAHGLRAADGSWCRGGVAELARRHPGVAVGLARLQLGRRARRATQDGSDASSRRGAPGR